MENKAEASLFLDQLKTALVDKFVKRVVLVHPASFYTLKERPALYLANHQTGIESLLLGFVLKSWTKAPIKALAKKEHRQSWAGKLLNIAKELSGSSEEEILFFQRDDPSVLSVILEEFAAGLKKKPSSLLIHVEGTRSFHSADKVKEVSSALIDLALKTRLPIVPVKFSGGLPQSGDNIKREFPWNYGSQEYYFGKLILTDDLEKGSLKERKKLIIDGINNLGPAEEVPLAGDPSFKKEVSRYMKDFGFSEIGAVFTAAVLQSKTSDDKTRQFIDRLLSLGGKADQLEQNSLTHRVLNIFKADLGSE